MSVRFGLILIAAVTETIDEMVNVEFEKEEERDAEKTEREKTKKQKKRKEPQKGTHVITESKSHLQEDCESPRDTDT